MYCAFSNKFVNFIRCNSFKNILQMCSNREPVALWQFRFVETFNNTVDMASSSASRLDKYVQLTSQFTLTNLGNFSVQMIDPTKQENRVSLLQCCGKLLSNKSLKYRRDLCSLIFAQLENLKFLGIEEYNMYINICTENEVVLDSGSFLKKMRCPPNEATYKLLLQNVSEVGDVDQAHELLSAMKRLNYVINEETFNALILAYTISSGYGAAQSVLNTMRTAQITPSSDTSWNIILGLGIRGDAHEFKQVLKSSVLDFNEDYFIKVVMRLGLIDCEDLIEMMKAKFNLNVVARHLLTLIEHLCIQLIHRNKASTAIKIYCVFTKEVSDETHYNFMLRELLEADVDPSEIVQICDYLKQNGKHLHALEFITNTVFTKRDAGESWFYLKHIEKLKPLYFWPILLKAGTENGEIGVLDALSKMQELNVEIDAETLEKFVLCFCEVSPPHQFLARIQHLKIPMRQLLTPLLALLLKNNNIDDVYKLCQEFKPQVEGEKLARPLAISWASTDNLGVIVGVMKKIYENNDKATYDFVGDTLVYCLKFCKEEVSYRKLLELLKMLHKEKLTITASRDEHIQTILDSRNACPMKDEIESALDKLLDITMNTTHIVHPRHMNVEELECHLVELTNKNMETRGVLRRLLQAHSRLGNYDRVEAVRKLIEQAGYKESPGMLALRLQHRINANDLMSALDLFDRLTESYPEFRLDEYKIINLVTALVSGGRFETAMDVLKKGFDNRNVRGGLPIERNCIGLLHAAKNPEQATRLFKYMSEKKICEAKNTIFGPILLSYIKCNDLENGVKYYEDVCKRYGCTPMQVEMLKWTLDADNDDLFKRVVDATTGVYGVIKTQMSMVVAFAEKGKKEALLKLLLEIHSVPNSELQNRCNRWVKSGSLEPLLTFIDAAIRLPRNKLNMNIPYKAIIRLFDNKNDIDGLLQFTNRLKENDVVLSKRITELVNALLRRNKRLQDVVE